MTRRIKLRAILRHNAEYEVNYQRRKEAFRYVNLLKADKVSVAYATVEAVMPTHEPSSVMNGQFTGIFPEHGNSVQHKYYNPGSIE